MFYIIFDLLRKLALTGLLYFVYQGSGTQLGFAIFITLCSKENLSRQQPYVDDANDSLANAGELQIILVFLMGTGQRGTSCDAAPRRAPRAERRRPATRAEGLRRHDALLQVLARAGRRSWGPV